MIIEYHRPTDIHQAIELLDREQPRTIPLGGGTVISHMANENYAVVDLQSLGFDQIEQRGNLLEIGAMVTLEQLRVDPRISSEIGTALKLETTLNTRNQATVAGAIVAGNGESPFLTVMLALDVKLIWQPGESATAFGDFLPLREYAHFGKFISMIQMPMRVELRFASVGRTPMDLPLLCIALARWPSGRMRLCLGGSGEAPILALDGIDTAGIESAAQYACSQLQPNRASKEYLTEATKAIIQRITSS